MQPRCVKPTQKRLPTNIQGKGRKTNNHFRIKEGGIGWRQQTDHLEPIGGLENQIRKHSEGRATRNDRSTPSFSYIEKRTQGSKSKKGAFHPPEGGGNKGGGEQNDEEGKVRRLPF